MSELFNLMSTDLLIISVKHKYSSFQILRRWKIAPGLGQEGDMRSSCLGKGFLYADAILYTIYKYITQVNVK